MTKYNSIKDYINDKNEPLYHYQMMIQLIYEDWEWLSSDKQREFATKFLDEIQLHSKISYKSILTLASLLTAIETNKYNSQKLISSITIKEYK